jgi:YidC/Oxa1 family membrane protein insertase
MEKRFALALILTALVVILTPIIFPGPPRVPPAEPIDGAAAEAPAPGVAAPAPLAEPGVASPVAVRDTTIAGDTAAVATVAADTASVVAGGSEWRIASPGANPVAVQLQDYRNLRRTEQGLVELVAPGDRLVGFRLVAGGDTIPLERIPTSHEVTGGVAEFRGQTEYGPLEMRYRFPDERDAHIAYVEGRFEGVPAGSRLLIDLPRTLRSQEADTLDDIRHLAFSYKRGTEDVQSIKFGKLDSALIRTDSGPMAWVAVRNKYFLAALIAGNEAQQFETIRMRGGWRAPKAEANLAHGVATMPLVDGAFSFQIYAGPQKYERLRGLGGDLENANPYGGWLHNIVQPFATIVMKALLWIKATTQLSYGWVLVIFGVMIRLMIWPLNQTAMRTSIRMQRLQPELQEVQKKYKGDPEKQREALMKIYASHGMSPLSPMLGCLPMMIPMPILFALYFVFQNTIEFRGVPFLWLPDLALKDPYYITPLFMGGTMFLLSLLGMRNVPQTPQTKMMAYMMPTMFTVIFLNFPSGLNLYYAVQNVVALPQQWLLTRERAKAAVGTPAPVPARK